MRDWARNGSSNEVQELSSGRNRGTLGVALAVLLAISTAGWAQPTEAMLEAATLGQGGDWAGAVAVLELAVSKTDADHGGAWFQLARAYDELERWDDVLRAATTALDRGFPRSGLCRLAMARAYSAKGEKEAAVEQVALMAQGGSNPFLLRALESDDRLEVLQEDPRFLRAVQTLTPCTAEAYRQFDFWLGDYRVENPGGAVVGENTVTLHLGGCMLMESWTGGSGSQGMSMNFYDPNDETWNQIYLDNSGDPGNWPPLKGRLEEDGSMVLWSPEGKSRSRWTWKQVAKGKVRQMAEQTQDGGKTWLVTWDAYYLAKEQ